MGNDLNNNDGIQRNSIYRIQIESGQVESELFKYNTLRETELDLFNADFAYTFDRSRSVFSFISISFVSIQSQDSQPFRTTRLPFIPVRI